MTYSLTWLPSVLRGAGLNIVEVSGWQKRGHGDVSPIKGVLCHHTAGAATGVMPSLQTLIHGRRDLPGPLCQLGLSRDGTYFIIAAGKAWHAGRGYWKGPPEIKYGNTYFIGIEAENTGYTLGLHAEPWKEPQMAAYRLGVAAILEHLHLPVTACAGHKEYALPRGRKTDPTFDMVQFRKDLSVLMDDQPVA